MYFCDLQTVSSHVADIETASSLRFMIRLKRTKLAHHKSDGMLQTRPKVKMKIMFII